LQGLCEPFLGEAFLGDFLRDLLGEAFLVLGDAFLGDAFLREDLLDEAFLDEALGEARLVARG
jgi:hypothetical protein